MYRYIGNKAKLTPYILDKVQQMIGDTGTVADIMAGTGTVSLELRKKGYKVVASDVMTYSYHHLNVNLCMKKPPEFLGLKDIITDDSQCMYESVLKYLNCIEPKKSFFYREFSPEGTPRNDKKRNLFQAMKDMLEYMDEKTSDRQFYFGTDDFDHVWEKLIDHAFGEKDKDKYFPRSRWLLSHGKYKEKRPLMPDTIMIYNGKYYILDAKCYKYGWTGIPEHLPNGSSINKQITYGEYLEKYKGIDTNSLFNAFIMPYNMEQNYFELTSVVGNIGEAVGDWRHNKKFYERIQGIVMDTRYLMYHYTGNPMKEKVALADCIEAVLGKGEVPPVGGAPKHTPVSYMDMSPKQSVSMVAESLNYNIGQEKK